MCDQFGEPIVSKIWKEIYIDYYQHGYDNAAIRFAYIPDFPTEQAKKDWERGYKDGMKKLEEK